MRKTGATVIGADRLRHTLRKLSAEQRDGVKRALMHGAVNIQTGAKRRVAVDTGRLRNSIAIDPQDEGLTIFIGTNVEYARRIEFGFKGPVNIPAHQVKAHTRKGKPVRAHIRSAHVQLVNHAAKPFLFPAFEQERPKIVAGVAQAVKSASKRSRR